MNGREFYEWIDSVIESVEKFNSLSRMGADIRLSEIMTIEVIQGIYEIAEYLGKNVDVRQYVPNVKYFEVIYRNILFVQREEE